MEIIAKAPASCGELIEGTLAGTPFLVTAPISMYATATVSDAFTGMHELGTKAQEALRRTLAHIGEESFRFGIRLETEIPKGKGMASSSADIAAVSYAVARAYGRELTGREIMDIAIAIEPSDGKVYSPVDGSVTLLAETGHALGLLSDAGAEVLLHIGIDTVELKGEPFTAHVAAGDKVSKGQLLMDVDLSVIKAAGKPATTMVIVTNTDSYGAVEGHTGSDVAAGDDLIDLT